MFAKLACSFASLEHSKAEYAIPRHGLVSSLTLPSHTPLSSKDGGFQIRAAL